MRPLPSVRSRIFVRCTDLPHLRRTETLFSEANAVWPSFSQTWVPKLINNRAEVYNWALGRGEYSGDTIENKVVIDKDGKETIVPTVVKKPKGPGKGVELQGKVGGRRRAVKPRTPSSKPGSDKESK